MTLAMTKHTDNARTKVKKCGNKITSEFAKYQNLFYNLENAKAGRNNKGCAKRTHILYSFIHAVLDESETLLNK